MTTPGIAIVGTGFGCLTHVRALRAAGFDVLALVGRDRDKTADRAKRFDIPNACSSLADALAVEGVDAVAVVTPPHTHADLVLEAIAAGRHVMCEKPFARDAAEAAKLRDAAEGAGVVNLLGCEFRFATGQAVLSRAVRDGAIGSPRLVTFVLHVPMLADPAGEVPGWWSDAAQGGGWLGAQASHAIDQMRTTVGEISGVSAGLNAVTDREGWTAEDSYTVHFRTKAGVEGMLQSTTGAWGPPLFLTRVSGTTGTIWSEFDTVWLADASGQRQVEVPDDLRNAPPDPPPADLLVTAYDQMHAFGGDLAPYTSLYEVFRDLMLGRDVADDPAPPTFADGVADMAVIDAIRRSSAERRWVDVALPG
jgi:predicted dehydrogenase